REIGDLALLARALTACGVVAGYAGQGGQQYFDEALDLARPLGDKWMLAQLLGWQTNLAYMKGDPIAVRKFGEEGRHVAADIGDGFTVRQCCNWLGWAAVISGDLTTGIGVLHEVEDQAAADRDAMWWTVSRHYAGLAIAHQGAIEAARDIFDASMPILAEMGDLWTGNALGVRATAMLAAGEVAEADRASALGWVGNSCSPTQYTSTDTCICVPRSRWPVAICPQPGSGPTKRSRWPRVGTRCWR
ncbi:MAG: hypothetical protein QOG37_2987, partial [Mycobacterium sp.]|nr:hypothetical protein [Mycobacterium sp.]